ncbi:MAG: single-stranded DNA-binding protein [Comamonas sp.]|nr:single-stranded DNA-binding protein [Comamonas sp.]
MTEAQKPQQLRPMQVYVIGRIDATRLHEKQRYSRVICPASDLYSRPQVVEIRSRASVGAKGDEIKALCTLGGFTRKPFRYTDKETGEVLQVTPVDMTLDLVE